MGVCQAKEKKKILQESPIEDKIKYTLLNT